MKKELGPGASV